MRNRFLIIFYYLMNTIFYLSYYICLLYCYISWTTLLHILLYCFKHIIYSFCFNTALSFLLDFLNSVVGWEPKKKYVIMNNKSEPMFYVAEKSRICWRLCLCLSPERSCKFTISDKDQQEVLYMRRPFKWGGGCICCYRYCQEVHWKEISIYENFKSIFD